MSIKFEKVNHIYGLNTPFEFQALKDVDLDILPGKITAVVGHTGSGKSTLIQHLNALLLPHSGTITIGEFTITSEKPKVSLKPLRKKVGMVFQFPEYQLFEETIERDICFGPKNFGVSDDEAKNIALKVIKQVGLDETFLSRSPFDLSGGQKRRVAIAGILALEPEILVLDEPTAGLDPQGAIEMMDLFARLNRQGVTIILVTHNMDHVLEYCDQVVVMNEGQVERNCAVKDLFNDHEYIHDLNIEMPMISKFISDINECGYKLDGAIKTNDELIRALKEQING